MARHQRVPVLIVRRQGVKLIPGMWIKLHRSRGWLVYIYQRLGGDGQVCVRIGDIEVMHPVAELAPVGQNLDTRAGMQLEIQAELVSLAAWLETHLHDALADRCAIAKARHMANGIIHLLVAFTLSYA